MTYVKKLLISLMLYFIFYSISLADENYYKEAKKKIR